MSLEQIKTVVEDFISDTKNELVVIKGRWGTGKTFFWQKLIEDSEANKRIGRYYYSYVSLFGINSLEELKNVIIASRGETNSSKLESRFKRLKTNLRQLTRRLERIPKLREYTGGMTSEFLFYLLDNTLICFDDIERRGNDLRLKEVFGLASLLKEQRSCKVLLIMNDEPLKGDELEDFKLHGEKIIDREIRFTISAEEAFDYIFQPSCHHHSFIKDCCLTLHIKNIRVLQRTKRFIKDITPYLKGREEKVAEDVLRSLILFVWSYYDKASDAPPLEYILDYSPAKTYIRRQYKKEEETPELKKWDEVLSSYNYFHTMDDVDKCLAEFVETGYVNKPNLKDALDKKNKHVRAQIGDAAYSKVWGIYHNSFDNNEEKFVNELVKSFRSNIKFLAFSDLQAAVTVLREFDLNPLADTLIDEYFSQRNSEKDIEAIKKSKHTIFVKDLKDEYLLNRLRDIWTSKKTDARSLADVLKITFKEYPNFEDIRHMDSFSADEYYNFFKTENSDELYHYVRKCLDFGELKDEEGVYKSISEKAKSALIKIASESRINRLRVSTLYKIDLS